MKAIDRSVVSSLRGRLFAWLVVMALAAAWAPLSMAQGPWGSGLSWAELSPAQRSALMPLQRDWSGIDAQRKQKWLELASRFDRMSPDERSRAQQRMSEWAQLSPKQRNEARLNFQSAQQLSTTERQESWEAYKALPEDRRRQLTTQGKVNSAPPPQVRSEPKAAGPKVNTVPNPLLSAGKPRPVTAGIVQAKPGASTTPITARPAPPLHQQPGLPKVAATPEFVDSTTLLPQRGAQGAATEPRRKP